jgi:hypothetical protein
MFQTRTRSEILMHGHLMAVRYGAPLEICANLLRLAESSDPLPVSGHKTVTLPVLNENEAE